MTLEKSTRAKIDNLAKSIIHGGTVASSDIQARYVIRTPSFAAVGISVADPDIGNLPKVLYLFGKPAELYLDALESLVSDQGVEHLTRKDLDSALT